MFTALKESPDCTRGHPLPYPPPVSAAPTQKAQAPSTVSRLNGYLNRLTFFLATSLHEFPEETGQYVGFKEAELELS